MVGMSTRRLDNNPKDFYRYISFYSSILLTTISKPIHLNFAMATYIFAYFCLGHSE